MTKTEVQKLISELDEFLNLSKKEKQAKKNKSKLRKFFANCQRISESLILKLTSEEAAILQAAERFLHEWENNFANYPPVIIISLKEEENGENKATLQIQKVRQKISEINQNNEKKKNLSQTKPPANFQNSTAKQPNLFTLWEELPHYRQKFITYEKEYLSWKEWWTKTKFWWIGGLIIFLLLFFWLVFRQIKQMLSN